jgi:putative colanic acid biosysnthesis UDP-glucose lipid carrier transferase
MAGVSNKGGILRGHEDLVHAFQRILDGVWIVLAHYFAAIAYWKGAPWLPTMTAASAIAVVVFNTIAEFNGLYRQWRSERISREIWEVCTTWLFIPPAVFFYYFATKTSGDVSRMVSAGWFLGAPLLLCASRVGGRLIVRHMRAQGRNLRNVAVLGATPSAEKLCDSVAERPWMGMRLFGIYDDRSQARRHQFKTEHCPYSGGVDDLIRDARDGKVDLVYIALPLRAEARVGEVLRALADTTATVYLMADFFTYDLLHARWTELGSLPMVSIYDSPFRGAAGWLKRLEDLVLGTIILAIIAVPLIAVAIAVKVTSKGPVFFRQRRYGLNGKEIRVLKFRSMTVTEDGPVVKQATKDDKRITPIGKIIRRTSLDELPQFLQVITGEMSIVGPRPHAVAHNEEYRALIHGYMLRHKVKPGITGWAQVNGWRGETDDIVKMEKRVQHDLEYIQNWHLLWDIKIILLTLFGSKKSHNAY